MYLVAVMDWYRRYVLSWALSVTMEIDFCLAALKQALRRGRPEIFNTDQGSQFTSPKFTGELETRGIAVSMDGRGRCFDKAYASYCTSCAPCSVSARAAARSDNLTPMAFRGALSPGGS